MAELLTRKEAADILKYKSERTIDLLVKRKELVPHRLGRSVRFLKDDILKYINDGRQSE